MAGNAVIGALRVVLGADTAALEKGLKDAQGRLSAFGSSAGKSLAIAGAAMSAAALGMAVAVKGALNEADKLGKMAQKIGVPVEELSALKHAADLSGLGIDALEKGVGKLSKTMVEAAAKPMSEAADAFRALGVSVTNSDGTLKSSTQVMADIAVKFEGLKDGAGKTAVSMSLFGKAGKDLIPLLNSGKDGLAGMMGEARQLGITLDTATAKSAEAFNDNLARLGAVFRGIVLQIASGVAPELEKLTGQMVLFAKETNLKEWGRSIGEAMNSVFGHAARLSLMWQRLGVEWEAFKKLFTSVPFTEQSRKAWEDYKAAGEETRRQLESFNTTLETMRLISDGAFGSVVTAVENTSKQLKDFNHLALGANNAIKQFIDGKKKQIDVLTAEAGAYNKSTFEADKAKVVAEGLAIATANKIPITEALTLQLQKLGDQYANANLKGTVLKQVFEQTRTPLEQFRAEIEKLNLAFDYGKTSPETYARAVAQAQSRLAQANPYAQALGQSLEMAFGRAIESGSKLSDVVKSLITDLTRALANAAFRQLLWGNAGAGGSSSGLFGSIFGGFRAAGGPVIPGMSYVVGENGPEIFTPSRVGSIVSNRDLGAGGFAGGTLNVHIIPHDDKFAAYVEDGAGRVVARSTPQIVGAAVAQSNSQAPGAVGRYQHDRGGEYRV